MHTKTVTINIPNSDILGFEQVDFDVAYHDIDADHSYHITVRDCNSGEILGEDIIHLYDEVKCGKQIHECFKVTSAGVCELDSDIMYKSIEPEFLTYNRVRFNIEPDFDIIPLIIPEFEIRIHYPEAQTESRFCRPISDSCSSGCIYVELPFLMDSNKKGICYAELLSMDHAIAGLAFNTAGPWLEGCCSGKEIYILDEYSTSEACRRYKEVTDCSKSKDEEQPDIDFERALEDFITSTLGESENEISEDSTTNDDDGSVSFANRLDSMTGLKCVKEKLVSYEHLVKFNRMREKHGLPTSDLPLHAMFLGAPGTGKTTVAKMMGKMLAEAGVLSKGHVIVKERATLLGPNYSMEETNTLKAIDEAQGGILFIDEAYQLCQPNDPRDPGKFVIEALLTALADESRRDWMLILAGYTDEMTRLFEINPGLKSRIPQSNIYIFEDFTPEELMEIAENHLIANGYKLSNDARLRLKARLDGDYLCRDKSFGNARHVINLIQSEILPAMAERVVESCNADINALTYIHACDIMPSKVISMDKRRPIGFRA